MFNRRLKAKKTTKENQQDMKKKTKKCSLSIPLLKRLQGDSVHLITATLLKTEWTENIKNASSFRTGLSMRESGTLQLASETEEEFKFGQTDRDTKDTGSAIKPMDEGDLFMLTGTYTRGNGRMTKVKDMECTCILMELSTRENGLRTNKKAMAWRPGLMGRSTKGGIKMA